MHDIRQDKATDKNQINALIIFSDYTDLWWLKILRRGFRHCAVLTEQNGQWILVDVLAHKTELLIVDVPDGFQLGEWLRDDGCVVCETRLTQQSICRPLWPAFSTCVESVKRILGIRQAFIFTPWQLYRHLQRQERIKRWEV